MYPSNSDLSMRLLYHEHPLKSSNPRWKANKPPERTPTMINMMAQGLKECITEGLSQKKWRRFDKSFDALAEARKAARKRWIKHNRPVQTSAHGSDFVTLRFIQRVPVIAEKKKEKPRRSQSNIWIIYNTIDFVSLAAFFSLLRALQQ